MLCWGIREVVARIEAGARWFEEIEDNISEAGGWITPDCSYESTLLSRDMGSYGVTFRRDPVDFLDEIHAQLVSMLVQDLVTILDDQMDQVLAIGGLTSGAYPINKLKQLKKEYLREPKYLWAYKGCVELIACRNVLTHAGGRWNQKSIEQIKGVVEPLPDLEDPLILGFPMLFHFRKAIRTFISQTELEASPRAPKAPKPKKAMKAKGQPRLGKRQKRRKATTLELERRASKAGTGPGVVSSHRQ